jgi:hypothetical protein
MYSQTINNRAGEEVALCVQWQEAKSNKQKVGAEGRHNMQSLDWNTIQRHPHAAVISLLN